MVNANPEVASPQVRPPMPHGLHQPDELSLIRGKLEMASHEWPTEVGDQVSTLVQDYTEASTTGVIVHHC